MRMEKIINWFVRNQSLVRKIVQTLLNVLTAAATALATSSCVRML